MRTPILGSSYVTRSTNAADARMVNLFPEIIPEGGKEPAFLSRTPGLTSYATIGSGPIRGLYQLNDILYVVSSNEFYSVTPDLVVTLIGEVSGTSGSVSIADNGTQIFIACNGPSFIYNSVTEDFAQINDGDFAGAVTVSYLNGYFVFNEPNSQKIWVTSLLEGTSIDPLDFASAEGSPDKVVGGIADHKEYWVFGENTTEVWYGSGAADYPLSPIQGAFNEIGCLSPYSLAKMDNGVFWLGRDNRGQGIVYRANGYTGERISTHAVEWQIQQYDDLENTIGYTYQQDGHSFYVLIFTGADTSWVYDVSTQVWHERASFKNNRFTRHQSNCQVFFNGLNVVGDYETNDLYYFDMTKFSDNGQPLKALRSWRALPTGSNTLKRTAQHSLQLDCKSGVGLNTGDFMNPQVILRWSDDAGHTWSFENSKSLGLLGQYGTRVIWRRLGMTTKLRDRVYEISISDPVQLVILGAHLDMSNTNA